MAQTVSVRAGRDAVLAVIRAAPGAVRAADAVMIRAGLAALGRIRRAFVVKARGGTDEAGDRWAPLSPRTVAYSPTRSRGRGSRTRTERKRDARPSQALTAKQQARWWAVYRQGLAIYRGDRGKAARRAWAVLKADGARTLLDKYGGRQVEILRDTGLLLNSLSPGWGGPEQVLRAEAGAVIIGTNRAGAAAHHRGVPGRLPQRRLWPPPAAWPAAWWRDVAEQVRAGVLDAVARGLGGIP